MSKIWVSSNLYLNSHLEKVYDYTQTWQTNQSDKSKEV